MSIISIPSYLQTQLLKGFPEPHWKIYHGRWQEAKPLCLDFSSLRHTQGRSQGPHPWDNQPFLSRAGIWIIPDKFVAKLHKQMGSMTAKSQVLRRRKKATRNKKCKARGWHQTFIKEQRHLVLPKAESHELWIMQSQKESSCSESITHILQMGILRSGESKAVWA